MTDQLPPASLSEESSSPLGGSLHDIAKEDSTEEIASAVETVVRNAQKLSREQISYLLDALTLFVPREKQIEYSADFDFAEEVGQQIAAVRAMREKVMDPSGQIKDEYSARDVKEVLASSTTLLSTLMRFHEKIVSIDRQRAIEQATVEAIRSLPDEQQEKFFSVLEDQLQKIR